MAEEYVHQPSGILGFVKETINEKKDAIVGSYLEKALEKVGGAGKNSLSRAYAPQYFTDMLHSAWDRQWSEISEELQESVMMDIGSAQGKKLYRELRIAGWASNLQLKPKGEWPRPFSWLRARLLYVHMPADSNIFKAVEDPFYWCLLFLKLDPYNCLPGIDVFIQAPHA